MAVSAGEMESVYLLIRPEAIVAKTHTSCDNWVMNVSFDWGAEKNRQLIEERGVSFDQVLTAILDGALLDVRRHPNEERYPSQMVYYVEINEYVYVVPLVVRSDGSAFLKTIIPSRKATRDYLGR